MKKQVLNVLLSFIVIFSFVACNNNQTQDNNQTNTNLEIKDNQTINNQQLSSKDQHLAIDDVDLDDKNIEEEWKKEPKYGKDIEIAFSGGLCTSPLGLGKVKGFYEKNGLNAKIVNASDFLAAVGTGKVDVTAEHVATSLVPALNGLDIIYTSNTNTGCKTLFVLKDSPVKSTKDLIGKTVAVGDGIGNSDHNITLRLLEKDDVDVRKVKFKNVIRDTVVQALQKDEVQAALLPDQFAENLLEEDLIRPIRSITFDDDFKNDPCCVLILNKTFVKNNPITAAKFTKAYKETLAWLEQNKREAAQLIDDENWGSGDVEKNYRLLKTFIFNLDDKYVGESIVETLEDYKKFGLISSKVDVEQAAKKVWHPLKSYK